MKPARHCGPATRSGSGSVPGAALGLRRLEGQHRLGGSHSFPAAHFWVTQRGYVKICMYTYVYKGKHLLLRCSTDLNAGIHVPGLCVSLLRWLEMLRVN